MSNADLVVGRHRQLDAERADRLHRRPRQGGERRSTTLGYADGTAVAAARRGHRGDRRSRRPPTDDAASRYVRARHVQQRRPPARAARRWPTRSRRSSRRRRSSTSAPACSAAARTIRSSCARRSTPRCAPTWRSIRSTRAACRRSCPAATRARPAAAATRCSRGRGVAQQFDTARRLAGHADRRSPPTPAAAPSPTPTTSARPSRASRATCPQTTSWPTPAATRRTDGRSPAYPGPRQARRAGKVDARNGYYAERDFGHTSLGHHTQLQDQLFSAVSATDLPVLVTAGSLRPPSGDKYDVPVSLVVPGQRGAGPQLPVRTRCRSTCSGWCGTSRDVRSAGSAKTLQLPPGTGKTLAGTQVLDQSGVTLPPGRFSVKAVVRENSTGRDGHLRGRR